jgi:phosphatidylserine synthase
MTPILATDYGNLQAFFVGVPALLLALLFVAFGMGFRARWLHIVACVIALLVGIQFFCSLPDANGGAVAQTKACGWGALALAVVAMLAAALTRPRLSATTNNESK